MGETATRRECVLADAVSPDWRHAGIPTKSLQGAGDPAFGFFQARLALPLVSVGGAGIVCACVGVVERSPPLTVVLKERVERRLLWEWHLRFSVEHGRFARVLRHGALGSPLVCTPPPEAHR